MEKTIETKKSYSPTLNQEKASHLREMLVVALEEGIQLGKISRIYFSPEDKRISGISFRKGMFGEDAYVSVDDIATVGEDVLIIRSRDKAKEINESFTPQGRSLKELQGRWVTTMKGNHLGVLVDVEIAHEGWKISELLLADGRDLTVETEEMTIGDDEVLVPEDSMSKLRDTGTPRGMLRRFFGNEVIEDVSNSMTRFMKKVKPQSWAKKDSETTH